MKIRRVDPYNRLRLWWRRRWDAVEATVVDTRLVAHKTSGPNSSYTIYEYLIDVPGTDDGSEPVRLSFKEQTHRVHGDPSRGDSVPVVVNAKRTKAMFDYRDPRVDRYGYVEAQTRLHKEQEDARFEARRAGREP